jgi:hypothetical protein
MKTQAVDDYQTPGIKCYTPEMGEAQPINADGEIRMSYSGKYYFIKTPLSFKTNRSIKHLETFTPESLTAAAQDKVGWNFYQVTECGLSELEKKYTFSMECLLD